MLELWCRHHGRLVGMENLFVIDHGSYEGIEVMLPPGVQRLRIPRGPVDNRQMSEFCGWFQRFLLSSYRWVLHTDADELVFLRSGGDFLSWIDGLAPRSTLRPELAIEVVHRPEEERMDFGRCVSEQRGRFVRNRNFSKPVLSDVPTAWTPGFHDCLNPSQESAQLCLAHIKHADSQMYVRRAETWRAAPQTVRDALIFPVATSRVYGVNTEMEFFEMVQGMDSASGEDVPDWMRGRF